MNHLCPRARAAADDDVEEQQQAMARQSGDGVTMCGMREERGSYS